MLYLNFALHSFAMSIFHVNHSLIVLDHVELLNFVHIEFYIVEMHLRNLLVMANCGLTFPYLIWQYQSLTIWNKFYPVRNDVHSQLAVCLYNQLPTRNKMQVNARVHLIKHFQHFVEHFHLPQHQMHPLLLCKSLANLLKFVSISYN